MIGDGQEHVCKGCFKIIAPHDPEAYQSGDFYYHSTAHEDMHASRNWNTFLNQELLRARNSIRERKEVS